MVTDTFFDLQRFDEEILTTTALTSTEAARDTLVGSAEGFTWAGGGKFGGAGTEEDPAYLSTKGASAISGTQEIYLKGTKEGYNLAVARDAADWNIDIKGSKNVVSGELSQNDLVYGLDGKVTVNVLAGKAFNETLNGSTTNVKAKGAEVPVTVESDGSTAINYTFASGVSNVAVGVDSNDKIVFSGEANNVTLSSKAAEGHFSFADEATISGTSAGVINITTAANTIVNTDTGESFEIDATKRNPVTYNSNDEFSGVKKDLVLNTDDGFNGGLTVNGVKWDVISGDMSEIKFDSAGNAQVSNTGAVTVKSEDGGRVGFAELPTAGVTVNDVKIQAAGASGFTTFAVDLDETGIEGIALDAADTEVKVTGDQSFDVTVGRTTYNVATTADDITFDAETNVLNSFIATVASGQGYSVTGGDALFRTDEIAANGKGTVTLNGAAVNINNNDSSTDYYLVSSDKDKAGVDEVMLLKPNDAIKVTGDSDGFTAYYNMATTLADDRVVSFEVNNAKVQVQAGYVDEKIVTVTADNNNNVTVQGIEGGAVVTVDSGATYHFKNARDKNTVSVASGTAEVTLNGSGEVSANGTVKNVVSEADKTRIDAAENKWQDISKAGSEDDTVKAHHGAVYNDFYDLGNSAVSNNTVAGYTAENDEDPQNESANINITGESPTGTPADIGDAVHVTLDGDSAIGNVPINIQSNENPNVKDVTINLTNSNSPSTVAVGTTGAVSASHNIQLSNQAGGYAYIGENAKGENVLTAGTGAAMLRHDGTSRNSLAGGEGDDSIRADKNDVVSGGAGADFFFDTSGYASDYNIAEGDIIIASRLGALADINYANVHGSGNVVSFGNNPYGLTLGNVDANAPVYMRVGVMDDDGNIIRGTRDVVLTNGNGLVDAGAAGLTNALIVSNASRDDNTVAQVQQVIGTEGTDTIYAGAYDVVSGAAGNDNIIIDSGAAGVAVAMSSGNDSVSGWNFGFDRAAGATQLLAGGAQVRGRVFEDRLLISLEGGESMSFDDTKQFYNHGQYDVLVDNTKFTAIRNGDAGAGYAYVNDNDNVADYYLAEREGIVMFGSGVTKEVGVGGLIDLDSENFQYIRQLALGNNSKTYVLGSSDRETVYLGGDASVGANKTVSLGGGNDVIYSGGDGNGVASHGFIFGAGDGRDSVFAYNHYQGIADDPDYQSADVIGLQSFAGVKAEVDTSGYTRVEFDLGTGSDYAVVYEAPGTFDYNTNKYLVAIDDTNSHGVAKIGYSTAPNVFTYDKEVSFYVGSSGEARDALVVSDISDNVEIRMDNSYDLNGDGTNEYYRGIAIVDASAETNTNISIAGSAANNVITAGGEGTNNFLWGGAGNNTLNGGAGNDFFLYYQTSNALVAGAETYTTGNNDVVNDYEYGKDIIWLGDVSLADINVAAMNQASGGEGYGITENAVTVSFNNGGSLTVNTTDSARFYTTDGVFTATKDEGWKAGAQ